MPTSVVRRDVIPGVAIFAALVFAASVGDLFLHRIGLVWVGRYLGIPGTVLIVGSMGYSLRKRKLISRGHPGTLLRWHELMAWLGSMLILVHAGIHLNAVLPWLAIAAMLVNVVSGLTGQFLLQRARKRLSAVRAGLQQSGKSDQEIEQALFWDAAAVDTMMKWRSIHFPISILFASLALGHISSIFLLWGWR